MKMKYLFTFLILTYLLSAKFYQADAQWKELNSDTNENLTGVAVIDSNIAIAVGDSGTILRTTDSGNSWQKIDLGITNNLNAITSGNPIYSVRNSVIIAGDNLILKSTDSGKNWEMINGFYNYTTISQGFTTPLVSVFSPDSSIILGTYEGRIAYTFDNGQTWKDTLLFEHPIITADFKTYTAFGYGTDTTVFAASSFNFIEGNIVEQKWDKHEIGNLVPWQNINSGDLAYNYQYLCGTSGDFAVEPLLFRKKQTDTLWTDLSDSLMNKILPNKIKNFRFGLYVLGKYGKIMKSVDNGDTWNNLKTPVNTHLNDISFYNEDIGYAVGDSGTILYTNNGGITSVNASYSKQIMKFKLNQNYPNPFNPSTVIKYSIPLYGFVNLTIYNNLGEKVETLVSNNQSAGEHSVTFNSNKLSSGVYFYMLKYKNSVQVKKMLLLR